MDGFGQDLIRLRRFSWPDPNTAPSHPRSRHEIFAIRSPREGPYLIGVPLKLTQLGLPGKSQRRTV